MRRVIALEQEGGTEGNGMTDFAGQWYVFAEMLEALGMTRTSFVFVTTALFSPSIYQSCRASSRQGRKLRLRGYLTFVPPVSHVYLEGAIVPYIECAINRSSMTCSFRCTNAKERFCGKTFAGS